MEEQVVKDLKDLLKKQNEIIEELKKDIKHIRQTVDIIKGRL